MIVYIDGATTRCCYVINDQEPVVVSFDEKVTTNTGEYLGLINALKAVAKDGGNKSETIKIFSDSQVIVNQFNLRYAINHEHLQKLYKEAKQIVRENGLIVKLDWIPREENKAGWVLG
jgi:ribonuclease HI